MPNKTTQILKEFREKLYKTIPEGGFIDEDNDSWREDKMEKWLTKALSQQQQEADEKVRWIHNYWMTLKQQGMTEKQLIIKFNKYITEINPK